MNAGGFTLGLGASAENAPKRTLRWGLPWSAQRDTHRIEPAALAHPQVRAFIEQHRPVAGACFEALEALWQRGARLLVLRDRDDRIVACGAVALPSGEVAGLFVDPVERHAGLGERLMRSLERDARRAHCRRLWLRVGLAQHAALHLFERLDYERCDALGGPARQSLLLAKGL